MFTAVRASGTPNIISHNGFPQVLEHDPSAEDWTRLRRYASWMRGLHLGSDGATDVGTLLQLLRGSPDGLLFPKLEWIRWDLRRADTALPFFRLFLSPSLRRVAFHNQEYYWNLHLDQVATLVRLTWLCRLPLKI